VLVLGQTVADIIIVALIGDKNMDPQTGFGWGVQSAHGDADPIVFDRIERVYGCPP
jgi:hypothetical protein